MNNGKIIKIDDIWSIRYYIEKTVGKANELGYSLEGSLNLVENGIIKHKYVVKLTPKELNSDIK